MLKADGLHTFDIGRGFWVKFTYGRYYLYNIVVHKLDVHRQLITREGFDTLAQAKKRADEFYNFFGHAHFKLPLQSLPEPALVPITDDETVYTAVKYLPKVKTVRVRRGHGKRRDHLKDLADFYAIERVRHALC